MIISLELDDEGLQRLDTLKTKLHLKERGEVLNHALNVLEWLIKSKYENRARLILDTDQERREVVFPHLDAAFFGSGA